MAGPQHHTPEYRRAYRAIKDAQRAGQWLTCMEPVCVMPTRDIAPWMPAHVSHDPTGTVILGPGHRRCNITEVNERRARAGGKRLRLIRNKCADCGQDCSGERCLTCYRVHLVSMKQVLADPTCPDCGAEVTRRGSRCTDCAAQANRDYMRDYMRLRYRRSVGIPDDAPVRRRRLEL